MAATLRPGPPVNKLIARQRAQAFARAQTGRRNGAPVLTSGVAQPTVTTKPPQPGSTKPATRPGSTKPATRPGGPAQPYNPLAPLTGKAFNQRIKADTRLQYGGQEQGLKNQLADAGRTRDLTSSAYDAYHQALQDALGKIDANDQAAITEATGRADAMYGSASADATTDAGRQSAAGLRALASSGLNTLTGNAVADKDAGTSRSANSLLAKAEALSRADVARDKITSAQSALKKAEGDFAVSDRGKLTDAERQYAAIQKEFGLKQKAEADTAAINKLKVSAAKASANTQVLVAKLNAAANKAQARATIRVAKLQLQKGKIDRHQYRTIVNVYKGLPKHGQSTPAGGSSGTQPAPISVGGSGGSGSGVNGTWSPSERKQIDQAVQNLIDHHVQSGARNRILPTLVRNGLSRNQALAAWNRYAKNHLTGGARPDTAGNPNVH